MYFDTHAHINFSAYKNDGEEVLKRSIDGGIFVINVGSQYSTSKRAVEYAHKFKTGVWATVGIHPIHLNSKTIHLDPEELESVREIRANGEDYDPVVYRELAIDEKVVAIGEIGLDYHHFDAEDNVAALVKKQKEVLNGFIDLANEVKKPVMLHCWGGYDDLLKILQNNPVEKKGVVHSFIGSYKTAKKFIELGYKIGLNGIATYGDSYDRLIREIDLKDILLETDCPYLTPRPLERASRNEPLFVKHVAQKIADVKGISMKEVERVTAQNVSDLFSINS